VTLLGVTQSGEGKLRMLTAEGQSIPGPTLRIGNTNSRLQFPLGPAEFVNRWCGEAPTHHCALGVGHAGSRIRKVGELLRIPVVAVC
jgi:L-arabinose isomerase